MKPVLTGSLMNGLDDDLLEWCDLRNLSDEDSDRLWDSTTEIEILENCSHAYIVYTNGPEIPGFTDTYYDIYAENLAALKAEVAEVIARHLK